MYLGVKGVLTKSFARIHRANLINFGIIPFEFTNSDDYYKLQQGNAIKINYIVNALSNGSKSIKASINGDVIELNIDFSERQRKILIEGGLLNYIRKTTTG